MMVSMNEEKNNNLSDSEPIRFFDVGEEVFYVRGTDPLFFTFYKSRPEAPNPYVTSSVVVSWSFSLKEDAFIYKFDDGNYGIRDRFVFLDFDEAVAAGNKAIQGLEEAREANRLEKEFERRGAEYEAEKEAKVRKRWWRR